MKQPSTREPVVETLLKERDSHVETLLKERDSQSLEWLKRAWSELPEGWQKPDFRDLSDSDVPERRYRRRGNLIEKWTPIYGKASGSTVAEVVSSLGGEYTPKQTGWRYESKVLPEHCQCKSGRFTQFGNLLVDVWGCGKSVKGNPEETPEEWYARVSSISIAPEDDYLNGMYPTLGGRDDKDPKSWITRGRSEYRQRTRGMIHWGSSSKDSASWNGNTLKALNKISSRKKEEQNERLRMVTEKWNKKSAPRKLGEL
jgi:hypothetical protein